MEVIDKARAPFEFVIRPFLQFSAIAAYMVLFGLRVINRYIRNHGSEACSQGGTTCNKALVNFEGFTDDLFHFGIILFWFYIGYVSGKAGKRRNEKFSPIVGLPIAATVGLVYAVHLIMKLFNIETVYNGKENFGDIVLIESRAFVAKFKESDFLENAIVLGFTSGII